MSVASAEPKTRDNFSKGTFLTEGNEAQVLCVHMASPHPPKCGQRVNFPGRSRKRETKGTLGVREQDSDLGARSPPLSVTRAPTVALSLHRQTVSYTHKNCLVGLDLEPSSADVTVTQSTSDCTALLDIGHVFLAA